MSDLRVLFREWALARQQRLSVRAQRLGYWCEYKEAPEYDTGYDGVPACWLNDRDIAAPQEWCPSCTTRQPLFEQERTLRKIERRALQRLQRLARKVT